MRFGVVLPQGESMREPAAARDFAQAVEGLGYDHLIAFDHVLGADPENRPPGWRTGFNHKVFIHEPLVLFGYLGGVTSRLEFSTEIVIMPQRQTALFAKQAAEVDYLTGGRLRLGLGIGWNALEFESLNEDFSNRGRRMSEQVKVMRALWTDDVVEFHGKWHHIDRAGINPRPVQRPIPVWMGGYAEAVLKRTAALADGWMPLFRPGEETSKQMTAKLKQYVRAAGRNEADFGIEGRINLGGANPEDWQRELDEWRGLGATHVGVSTPPELAPDEHIAAVRRFKELVG